MPVQDASENARGRLEDTWCTPEGRPVVAKEGCLLDIWSMPQER